MFELHDFDAELLNFAIGAGIGLVVGLIVGFVASRRNKNALWLAPVLAIVAGLAASVFAAFFGEDAAYGWKEAVMQSVAALIAAVLTFALPAKKAEKAPEPEPAK